MTHKIFTVKIQLFHLGFIAEIIIDPTRQSNRFEMLSKSWLKIQKWTVTQKCTVLKLDGLESNRRISDRPISVCWAVHFDLRPISRLWKLPDSITIPFLGSSVFWIQQFEIFVEFWFRLLIGPIRGPIRTGPFIFGEENRKWINFGFQDLFQDTIPGIERFTS